MKRRFVGVVCITWLLGGALACSSDERETAASTVEAVEAAEAADVMQNRGRGNPGSMAANTIAAARDMARSVHQPKLNLNTASSAQLATLPDVGKKMVHEFEEYRPFASIRQFRKKIGKYVDETQLAAYEKYVYVPIDVNESDAETLAQIPGVTESVARKLKEKRPYSTNASFLMELAKHVSDPEARTGAAYLKRR